MNEILKTIIENHGIKYDESIKSIYDDDINTLLDNIEAVDENIEDATRKYELENDENKKREIDNEIDGLQRLKSDHVRNIVKLLQKR